MKAAVYPGSGKPLVIETLPDPEPGRRDLVIRVHRCGVCGTDLHMTEGHAFQYPAGCVPGHEYAGEVVAVGADVNDWKAGDLLTALPSTGCGHCEACAHGNLVLCRNAPGVMGGFAEYLRVPAEVAVKLPAILSLADGALVEPMAVGLYGVRQARLGPGSKVLVLGAGSVALCVVWWARRLGAARIVVASRSARRAEMALAMGADAFVTSGEAEDQAVVAALGGGPDLVFECVGSPGLLGAAIRHACTLGTVVSMGFCTKPDPIIPAMAGYKGVSLLFPVGYTLADFHQVADLMDKGHVDPKLMITSVIGLGELPAALAALRGPNTETKVHIAPSGGAGLGQDLWLQP